MKKLTSFPLLSPGSGTEQLLCVPKLPSGTGKAVADALMETVSDWDTADKIKALSFDTTSAYTDRLNAAGTLFEQHLGRDLLHLACRHHILEIILEEAFSTTMGPSTQTHTHSCLTAFFQDYLGPEG